MTKTLFRAPLVLCVLAGACTGSTVDDGASTSGGPGRRDAGFMTPDGGGGNGASSSSSTGGVNNNASSSSSSGGVNNNASSSSGGVNNNASSSSSSGGVNNNASSSSGGVGSSNAVSSSSGGVGNSSTSGSGGGGSSGIVGSSSSSSGGTVVTDPVNADAYCTTQATAVCAWQARCDPQGIASIYDSEALCVSWNKADCLVNEVPVVNATVGSNTAFSQANFTACYAAVQAAACDANPFAATACRTIFTGTLAQGAACHQSTQCAPALACTNIQQGSGCGTCQPRVAIGQTCGPAVGACQPDALCIAAAQGATTGTCTLRTDVRKPAGQACNTMTGPACEAFGDCNVTNATTGAGTCQLDTILAPGAACDLDNAFQACPITQQCKFTNNTVFTGTCTNRPASGAACNLGLNEWLCEPGQFCSAWENTPTNLQDPFRTRAPGTCVARRALNGQCNDPDLVFSVTSGGQTYDFDFSSNVCSGDLFCDATFTCVGPSLQSAVPSCP